MEKVIWVRQGKDGRKGHHRAIKVTQTKNFNRYRQFEPNQCKQDSFRTKRVNSRTELILCKKKHSNKQSVQSIIKHR